jgi:sigma-B regulation protein RsbU (phosphoserine phosphatase)
MRRGNRRTPRASRRDGLRRQLLDRRRRLAAVTSEIGQAEDVVRLLHEVDATLERLGAESFGRCEVCHEPMGDEQLRVNPMSQYCLCELEPEQLERLQHDLNVAWRLQAALLPKQNLTHGGWEIHFRYQPAGPVSGDYCDVIVPETESESLYFVLGDISGKGVAAAFLMAHLNALVRSLVRPGLDIPGLLGEVDRLLAESTPSSHFATLVCGRAGGAGEIEICNAGHCLPIVVSPSSVETVDTTGLPVGIGDDSVHETRRITVASGDSIVLYTDGITEARNCSGRMYGLEPLARVLAARHALSPAGLAEACLQDLASFRDGAPRHDDVTMMVIRRSD